ncbi:MAG: hypothetical protein PGN25_01145 [Methylorubrum populi]
MIPGTAERIPLRTDARVNRRIAADIDASVKWHAEHPQAIGRRLRGLDAEWDIERTLEANTAALALAASAHDRRPALARPVAGRDGIPAPACRPGWCPPLPILRRLGFRTAREIEVERNALKALRGDYGPIGPDAGDRDNRTSHALMAARL